MRSQQDIESEIANYEGLIFSTAIRYVDFLDEDLDDISQQMRVKVWKALVAFDPKRSELAKQNFIFGCLSNLVKDMLKSQSRKNDARKGRMGYIEEVPEERRGKFEAEYLAETHESAYREVEDEDVELPSTLTELECQVVQMLLDEMNQTQIAKALDIDRRRVRQAHEAIQRKMCDWAPASTTAIAEVEAQTPVAA